MPTGSKHCQMVRSGWVVSVCVCAWGVTTLRRRPGMGQRDESHRHDPPLRCTRVAWLLLPTVACCSAVPSSPAALHSAALSILPQPLLLYLGRPVCLRACVRACMCVCVCAKVSIPIILKLRGSAILLPTATANHEFNVLPCRGAALTGGRLHTYRCRRVCVCVCVCVCQRPSLRNIHMQHRSGRHMRLG